MLTDAPDNASANNDQQTLWKGSGGRAWVDLQAVLDQVFLPFERLLAAEVSAGKATRVLDIGCGAGATTLAIARAAGSSSACRVTGIDISESMINAARQRAASEGIDAEFVCADGGVHPFPAASFDWIVSRFGVMFFRDPVSALANIRHAAASEAQVRFVTWRQPSENPFMTTAERTAAPLLPQMPARELNAPGQFGLADPLFTRGVLEHSGWENIQLRPLDVECRFAADHLESYFTRLGPVAQALQQVDDEQRRQVIDALHNAFAPFVQGGEVRFDAACWLISASAPRR